MQKQLAESQKLDALGQLTGGVAHDFNNLLMVIGGSAQVLKKYADDEKSRRAVEAIESAARRGAALTSQLLTFARRQNVNPQTIRLSERIDAVREVLSTGVGGIVQLTTDVKDDVWPIKVDISELETALINLVINARDAMPDGGAIRISAENVTLDDEAHKGDFVAIRVSDTGTGHSSRRFAESVRPVLYHQAGRQGHRPWTFPGARLCLSGRRPGCRSPANWARAPPSPSRCRATNPELYRPGVPARRLPAAAPSFWWRITRTWPRQAPGCSSNWATRCGGFRMPKRRWPRSTAMRIDLVFSDIVMPGKMDGLALAQAIREKYPRLPILLATGYSDTLRKVSLGFQILRKPYEIHELSQALAKVAAAPRVGRISAA